MALRECFECGNSVSTKAISCPHCGAPVSGARESRAAGAPLTTVQETSKKFKLHTLLALTAFFGAIGWMVVLSAQVGGADPGEFTRPIWLLVAGVVWYAITRVRIWWHHR